MINDQFPLLVFYVGTTLFLHWLAGMIFIFYLASFVMLLREILRPGVLWFLRNLNDQNFHPINEVGMYCVVLIDTYVSLFLCYTKSELFM